MSDMQTFPETVDEFMEHYKVIDKEGVYMSKGVELVPIFRMKQWFEHLEQKKGRWIKGIEISKRYLFDCFYCSNCHKQAYWDTDYDQQLFDYCPYCGSFNGGQASE